MSIVKLFLGFHCYPSLQFSPSLFQILIRPYHSIEILHRYHLILTLLWSVHDFRCWFLLSFVLCPKNRVSYSLLHLYIMNDKVVTYVKYFFEKILFFQSIYITSSKLNNKSNEFNQYQGFTVENIHSYATLWFYCFKIEYDIIEEFETKGQIQNFYTETTSTFKFWVICILYWPTTPFFCFSNHMCNLFVINILSLIA